MSSRKTIPGDAPESRATLVPSVREPFPTDFPTTGANVFARVCQREGLSALFCCPGNYTVVGRLVEAGIPTYAGRHEGHMTAAADAFIRMSGELAACSGTEGPGFTNMISGIAAAHAARTPLLVLASNHAEMFDGTEVTMQSLPQQPMTADIRKYGKRIVAKGRIHEYAASAFRNLRTGVPGPVHLDFPREASDASIESEEEMLFYYDKAKYRTEAKAYPDPSYVKKLAALIASSRRPMIVSSTGVFYSKAWDALRELAEKADIAVVESGPMRGQFSDEHPLSASRAPGVLPEADLVIFVGQYCMPTQYFEGMAFSPDATVARIDPEAGVIGQNVGVDVGIVSDEATALRLLCDATAPAKRPEWVQRLKSARDAFVLENAGYHQAGLKYTDCVHPAVISKDLGDFLSAPELAHTPIVQGGYGIARYTRRWLKALRPGQILNASYQFGTIGLDIPYAFGFGVAVEQEAGVQAGYGHLPVVCITGDAGFGISGMELETFVRHKIPAVIVVYNNNSWGTWKHERENPAIGKLHLMTENLRYDRVCEALGGGGRYVQAPGDFRPALEQAHALAKKDRVPVVLNCQGKKELWLPENPPGFLEKVEPGCMAYNH